VEKDIADLGCCGGGERGRLTHLRYAFTGVVWGSREKAKSLFLKTPVQVRLT
jgi:hypothetical protein